MPTVQIVAMDPPARAGALAPNLHAAEGAVLAVWLEPTAEGHRLQFSRWMNAEWTSPTTIVESANLVANWADTPSVVAGSDGALVAHWAERAGSTPYAYHAVIGRSVDGGATWRRLGLLHNDRSPTEHGFVSLVAEGASVRAFWLDGRATGEAGGATSLRTVCRHELPELAELHRRFASRGAEVIAASVDRERSRDDVSAFVAKRAFPFPVWLDPDDRVSSAFGVATLPATILIDRDGIIRWRHDGAIVARDGQLLAHLERALKNEGAD